MRRIPENRRSSARKFNRREGRRHAYNFRIARGGWRL